MQYSSLFCEITGRTGRCKACQFCHPLSKRSCDACIVSHFCTSSWVHARNGYVKLVTVIRVEERTPFLHHVIHVRILFQDWKSLNNTTSFGIQNIKFAITVQDMILFLDCQLLFTSQCISFESQIMRDLQTIQLTLCKPHLPKPSLHRFGILKTLRFTLFDSTNQVRSEKKNKKIEAEEEESCNHKSLHLNTMSR